MLWCADSKAYCDFFQEMLALLRVVCWDLESCLICRNKMNRLRIVYSLQFLQIGFPGKTRNPEYNAGLKTIKS